MCSRRPSPTRKRSPRSARMGRPGWRQTAKRHTHNSRERRAHSHKTKRAEMPAPRDVEMGGSPRATTSPYLPGCGGAGMRPLKEHSAVCLARPRGGPDRAAASRPPERRSGATPMRDTFERTATPHGLPHTRPGRFIPLSQGGQESAAAWAAVQRETFLALGPALGGGPQPGQATGPADSASGEPVCLEARALLHGAGGSSLFANTPSP